MIIVLSVLGREQSEGFPHGIPASFDDFASDMRANTFDIGNQLIWLLKNICVDLLQNIFGVLFTDYKDGIGMIDMSSCDRLKICSGIICIKHGKNIHEQCVHMRDPPDILL